MLRKLADKGATQARSRWNSSLPKFQDGDPHETAREIKPKAEAVMRRAKVI